MVCDGSIIVNNVILPVPSSAAWKDNISEVNDLEWIDSVKIYSFDYNDDKLRAAGIDPRVITSEMRHTRAGYLMHELDPSVYI